MPNNNDGKDPARRLDKRRTHCQAAAAAVCSVPPSALFTLSALMRKLFVLNHRFFFFCLLFDKSRDTSCGDSVTNTPLSPPSSFSICRRCRCGENTTTTTSLFIFIWRPAFVFQTRVLLKTKNCFETQKLILASIYLQVEAGVDRCGGVKRAVSVLERTLNDPNWNSRVFLKWIRHSAEKRTASLFLTALCLIGSRERERRDRCSNKTLCCKTERGHARCMFWSAAAPEQTRYRWKMQEAQNRLRVTAGRQTKS